MKILIINGPNLNLLEHRDQATYGSGSLQQIEDLCTKKSGDLGVEVEFFQSNSEGELVSKIQGAINNIDGIVINAAGYTHTSVAIRDAIEMFKGKKIEIHISNIYAREDFRHKSLLSDVVNGVICGIGIGGYEVALDAIVKMIKQ